MGHTVIVKLNKAANEFQAGDSIGFNVRGGVQYYDRKTKQKEWTNYSGVVFAKASGQIDFYRSVLVEGAVVELGGKQQKIDVYQGNNGPINTIEMIDAWLGAIYQTGDNGGQQETLTQQQPAQQQAASKMAVIPDPVTPIDDFEDDIPF